MGSALHLLAVVEEHCAATGDGNCGFMALAVAIVVSVAGQHEGTREAFARHMTVLANRMRDDNRMQWQALPGGACAADGCSMLLVSCCSVLCCAALLMWVPGSLQWAKSMSM